MVKQVLSTVLAPRAIGPYSQAIEINGTIYCSGQIPIDPQTGELVEGTIEVQAERVMKNVQAVLAQAGVGFDHVVKTTCFLADLADFQEFNAVYGRYFPENPPARSCVAAAGLPKGAKVEVEVIAVK